jgi:hypothetical protein
VRVDERAAPGPVQAVLPALVQTFPAAGGSRKRGADAVSPVEGSTGKPAKRSKKADDAKEAPSQPSKPSKPAKAEPAPKPDPENPEATSSACGNCGLEGHKARVCVKCSPSGWMDTCPKCDRKGHLYENCRFRNRSEDYKYLIWNRQVKPPVKSTMSLGKLIGRELQDEASGLTPSSKIDVPYSSKFARQEARVNPHRAWDYRFPDNPVKEAALRMPEPGRQDLTAAEYRELLSSHQWSSEAENFDFSQDEPLPTQPPRPSAQGHIPAPVGLQLPRPSASALGFIERSRSRSIMHSGANTRFTSVGSSHGTRVRNFEDLAAGMEQLDTGLTPTDWLGNCRNCTESGHTTAQCQKSCLVCGRGNHNVLSCDIGEPCICDMIPNHDIQDCVAPCRYCAILFPMEQRHLVMDCKKVCHLCLDPEHETSKCKEKSGELRPCPRCHKVDERIDFHFPSACPQRWCPVTRTFEENGCPDHCMQCGYSKAEERDLLGDEKHKCQFTAIWLPDPDERSLPVMGLKCKMNMEHQFELREILANRQKGQQEIRAMKQCGQPIDPWPLEGPICIRDSKDVDMSLDMS